MSARDDYPSRRCILDWEAMCDEIDRLRIQLDMACRLLGKQARDESVDSPREVAS